MKLKNNNLKVNIVDFGAVSGCDALQTDSIQKAIDYCYQNGGGEIQIPKGEFLTGGIRLRSNTTLHLLEGSKLVGSRNPNDYFVLQNDNIEPVPDNIFTDETKINGRSIDGIHFGRRWFNSLIKVYKAKNVSIIGDKGSVIDGNDCYDEKGEEGFRGPHCICVCECKNIRFYGITVINSANWAYCIWSTKNIVCEKAVVKAGHDGFDVFSCQNVFVEDCDFYSGDDCVAGYSNYKVTINNCRLSSTCSAFRFAGTQVKISNCEIDGNSKYVHRYTLTDEEKITGKLLSDTENPNHRYRMKSFFTYYADYRLTIKRLPSKIFVENCTITDSEKFLHFNYSGNESWQQNRPLKEIRFKNITVEGLSLPMVAYGDRDIPFKLNCENIEMELSHDYRDDCLIHAANLERIILNNFNVKNFKGKVIVRNYGNNNGKIILHDSNVGSSDIDMVEETNEKFIVTPI